MATGHILLSLTVKGNGCQTKNNGQGTEVLGLHLGTGPKQQCGLVNSLNSLGLYLLK